MKKIYLFAAVAALFAACSSDNLTSGQQAPQAVAANDGSIGFDGYVTRATRSGDPGTQDIDKLKVADKGFGVFGYYTNNNEYDGTTFPDYFYNQHVTWNSVPVPGYWKYEPVKYWPNEYGNSAISDDVDKVSFFAYAPWVNANVSNGKVTDQTYGITQLNRNAATGDPFVKYIASFDYLKTVDLLWGVIPSNTTWKIVSGAEKALAGGMPWLNVERPLGIGTQASSTTDERVKFQFKHALSQLNVTVDYDADQTVHGDNVIAKDETRIYIRSISFTGFSVKGALNLNNEEANKPTWKAYDTQSELASGETTTLYDGRKDGSEGVSGSAAPAEPFQHLNPLFIQTVPFSEENASGVQTYAQNLFNYPGADLVKTAINTAAANVDLSGVPNFETAFGVAGTSGYNYKADIAVINTTPIMVIPNGEEMVVTIAYDVETKSANLGTRLSDNQTAGASIPNVITKKITFPTESGVLEAGKKYTLNLHLGMNSVKFDAAVDEWQPTTPPGSTVEGEGWLPSNQTSYQAPGTYNYYVLAETATVQSIALTGFTPGEHITVTGDAAIDDPATATATGTAIAKLTPSGANNTVLNRTDRVGKWKGDVSGKEVVINLVQAAAQPTYKPDDSESNLTFAGTTGTFVLMAGSTAITDESNIWTGPTRNVEILSATRNGLAMTEVSDTPNGALQFKVSANRQITLATAATGGETFTFIVKAGDAQPVTITKKITTP